MNAVYVAVKVLKSLMIKNAHVTTREPHKILPSIAAKNTSIPSNPAVNPNQWYVAPSSPAFNEWDASLTASNRYASKNAKKERFKWYVSRPKQPTKNSKKKCNLTQKLKSPPSPLKFKRSLLKLRFLKDPSQATFKRWYNSRTFQVNHSGNNTNPSFSPKTKNLCN